MQLKPLIKELLRLPPGVEGYLEWVSGILRVNQTKDGWDRYRSSGPAESNDARRFSQVITHENFHFLQIITAGYLYRFVARFASEVGALLPKLGERSDLESLLRHPPQPTPELHSLFAAIDEKGPGEVSVRDLVESAALLYEMRHHWSGLTPEHYSKYLEHVEETGATEYASAFRLTERALGPDAFGSHLFISFLALCFDRPQQVFLDAVEHFARNGLSFRGREDLEPCLAVFSVLAQRHAALGSSAEVLERSDELKLTPHRFYSRAILLLDQYAATTNPLMLVVDPSTLDLQASLLLVRPVVFDDADVWVPDSISRNFGYSRDELIGQLVLAAVVMRLIGSGASPARPSIRSRSPADLEWINRP